MIANVRRFSTSARKSMTERNSTALRRSFAILALFSAAFFWGGNAIASKILYRPDGGHFDAFSLVVARAIWSLPLFLVLAWFARPGRSPTRADAWRLIATGVCFGPGACGFMALAAQYTSGAHVVMLMSLSPPFTAIVSAFVLRERVDAARVAALAVGIAGAALLSFTNSASGSTVTGDLFEVVQMVFFSLMFVFTRGLGTRYSPFFVSGTYGTIGMLLLVAGGLAAGRLGPYALQPFASGGSTLWWFFGEIVIGLSIYGQTAQSYALRTLGAGITSLISAYGTLIVGVIGAVILLGERLSVAGWAAAALLALALALGLAPARAAAPGGLPAQVVS
jgi:drug/metabolite transporter (DMT)-like permease